MAAMNWKSVANDVLCFLVGLTAASFAHIYLRTTGLYEFTAAETEGLNTVILLVGSIFAVVYAFVIFVIWGQFTEVENFVIRECNDLLRFSYCLNADAGRTIRRAVGDYGQHVLKHEWKALAQRRRDRQSEKAFSELIAAVVGVAPANAAEEAMQNRLIDFVRKAGEHRDERVAKSLTRIPGTLERLVVTMATVILLLVFVYPFRHPAAGFACFTLVGVVLFLAWLVMKDTDNPFEGVCNVSPQPFADLALER
jgi:hypothetical protein